MTFLSQVKIQLVNRPSTKNEWKDSNILNLVYFEKIV